MTSFTTILTALCVAAGVLAIPAADSQLIQPRQSGNFITQNWANDFADLDYKSGPAGQFAVDWNNGPGGNFVVGKGYRPGGDM